MARSLTLTLAFMALIGSGAFLFGEVRARQIPPRWPVPEKSGEKWLKRSFGEVGEVDGDHFDFRTGLQIAPGTGAVARLAVHYQPPTNKDDAVTDYLYLELVDRYLSLVAARGGFHRVLAHVELPAAPRPGVEHALELRRRGPLLVAVLDGRVRAAAFVEGFSGGKAAIGVRGKGFEFVAPTVYKLDPVLFMDDFMRTENAASPWQTVSGTWKNQGLRNPSMSANAFRFSGSGSPALAVTGQDSWDFYSYAASFKGPADGKVGLVFNYRDKLNYYLFRWTARENPARSGQGLAELVRVAGGAETVLQRSMIGYVPEQWYRAEVRLGYGWAEVYVDEHLMLQASDPALAGGRVGLWANTAAEPALFDDMRVAEATFFRESFVEGASAWRSWDRLGGEWNIVDREDARGLEFSAGQGGGVGVFGSERWGNYVARAEILPRSGRSGLVFHYRDATNYSCLSYDVEAGRLELVKYVGGQRRVRKARDVKLSPGMHTFEVGLDRGLVRCRVDGRHELVDWQTDKETGGAGLAELGRIGLAVWHGRALARGMSLQLSGEIEPLPSINPIFATDREMTGWSSWQGDWALDPKRNIRWHRAKFAGDVTLLVEVAKIPGDDYELVLSVAKSGTTPGNGYILKLVSPVPPGLFAARAKGAEAGAAPPGGTALILTRDGETVAKSLVPDSLGRVWTLALRKAGPFLMGYVNSRQVLTFFDGKPLTGQKVAWYSRGVEVEEDGFRVYSPAVLNYPFSKAPSDWRVAAGLWEVSNRWQCDPRWSFFSGRSLSHQERLMTAKEQKLPKEQKLQALIWNKREFGDNVVVEFFAGIKMLRRKGGGYQYARDINCTISADGKDASSGYNFLFGGFDNDRSVILRKGKEVARMPSGKSHVIPRSGGIHHRWFYVRAERRGPKLLFTVDGGQVVNLEYTDPDPLRGTHVAIWTWDCGIMISRVRISGAASRGFEPTDFVPGEICSSPYQDE